MLVVLFYFLSWLQYLLLFIFSMASIIAVVVVSSPFFEWILKKIKSTATSTPQVGPMVG